MVEIYQIYNWTLMESVKKEKDLNSKKGQITDSCWKNNPVLSVYFSIALNLTHKSLATQNNCLWSVCFNADGHLFSPARGT